MFRQMFRQMFQKMFQIALVTMSVMHTITSTPASSYEMILSAGSNCTALGYPESIPHIKVGYESGPGKCCLPTTKLGGSITMCLKSGTQDQWSPCPPGTCNKHLSTSDNQFWMNNLSEKEVCKKSHGVCTNQVPTTDQTKESNGGDDDSVFPESNGGDDDSVFPMMPDDGEPSTKVEPNITCLSLSASPGERRVVMNCSVTAPDVTCKNVVWITGLSTETFEHGGKNLLGYYLTCKSCGTNCIWTALELRGLNKNHFEDTYFIRVNGGANGDYQEGVKLTMKESSSSGATDHSASVMLVALVLSIIMTRTSLF